MKKMYAYVCNHCCVTRFSEKEIAVPIGPCAILYGPQQQCSGEITLAGVAMLGDALTEEARA